MRVKVRNARQSLHPNETVVEIKTDRGTERLTVAKRDLSANSLEVGSPLAAKGDFLLIELPRETMTGTCRVWVKRNSLIEDRPEARVA